MLNNIDNAYPAGDESNESSDEWDIGYSTSTCTNRSEPEVTEVTLPCEDKVSVLKRAIAAGDVDLVRQLLDNGMDVETRLGFGWTPLMCAVHVANYELVELLLDRGASANFSRDLYTVLMAACTADSTTEEKIAKCVALLLSRNADPNAYNRSHMTCLMLAARNSYCQVINLLVSHGAELNFQDNGGHTALMLAVQYGREAAVLKLLQLGADKSIKNKAGKTATDLAKEFKHPQICRILESLTDSIVNGEVPSKAEVVFQSLNRNPEGLPASKERYSIIISAKLCDIELLLHGLNLEYLSDIIMENDINWSCLLTMEKEDLEKLSSAIQLATYIQHLLTIGVTDPDDQKKVLSAVQEMHLDRVDLDALTQLENVDNGTEELYNFLISLRQQCCYLTEMVQDVISRFPRRSSELVLTWDPKKEAQAICTELVAQTGDLQKEVTCLRDLLSKMDQDHTENTFQPPLPISRNAWKKRLLKKLAVGMLGAGLLLLLSQARHYKVYL
ncbi:ankyrin repeat, SAM and basic leucine zipper domain-containing protein 1 isoform X2 [Trichomycterus rosablanca]|uniref:ankyrin repeat, SAM and basic leucine zipper domain-containing protein 1 isoform X2 n=1 Tax=Trichomycterus rosablanca TaxID=2290929 RepID=UPI002F359BD9